MLTIIEFEMPYYHLRIKQKNSRGSIYLYDFTRKRLEEFLATARKGRDILWSDVWIDPKSITDIEVAKTNRKSEHYGIGFIRGENIFNEAENATSQFVRKPSGRAKSQKIRLSKMLTLSKDVFIVHGRDRKSLKELKSMLKEFGLNPIVLHEQPSGSRTIVEKLEKYSDVGYAFVILTPDDAGEELGQLSKRLWEFWKVVSELWDDAKIVEVSENGTEKVVPPYTLVSQELLNKNLLNKRARQNVVLEFGYFMGLIGRDKVCCLYKGNVELPSDMHGIVYIPFKESVEEARDMIIEELKEAGYEIKS